MFDKVQITVGIHLIEKLIKTHDEMRKRNPAMAEQDIYFVIDRLCDEYLNKRKR